MADEKLVRLHNLKNVLKSKRVEERDRARHLSTKLGSNVSYWSGLLAGARPFGEKVARRIEEGLGLPRTSLDSEAHNWTPEQHPSVAPAAPGVAQELSDLKPDDELTPQPWEFVLSAVILPKRFCVAVPDGALAPKSPKGTEFVFVSPPPGTPGESVAVIVQTANGQRYIRLYFAAGGGAWEARARDAAFPSFHSERDGLQLLAVATMRTGGEG